MARAKNHGNGRIEEAIARLLRNQLALLQNIATLVQTQATFVARMSESRPAYVDIRFARIEAILAKLLRMAKALPDAICEKIGFKTAR